LKSHSAQIYFIPFSSFSDISNRFLSTRPA
jgi:hypothetical protein